jgi:A118 family predicted phage portal protein
MFSKLFEWIRSMVSKMFTNQNVKQALGVDVIISQPMASALQLWAAMYKNESPWLNKDVKALGLPASISSEIARMATIEMSVVVSGSPRADFLNMQMERIVSKLRQYIEFGNAKGGLVFKPFARDGIIAVDCIQADMFYPVSFDASGNMTAVIFADVRKQGTHYYTRLESHQFAGNVCTIKNMAYKSSTENALGNQCSLSEVADWSQLQPEATITGITAPLYGYYRYPSANNVDTTSPLGVSCFSRAQDANGGVELIKQADEIYSSLVWEFESGKRALYVDELAFEQGTDNKPKLPDRRLYRTLKMSGQIGKTDDMFKEWSPAFREASIKSGLDAVLKKIEFACGLAYGVISDAQAVALTATEIKSSQQRTYATVTDTQKAVETALGQLISAMDVYATLYNLAPRGTYTATYEFDDSVITDKGAQFIEDGVMVDKGAMSLVEYRMRTYGEDEATAKAKILMARTERADRVMDRVAQVRQ